MEPLCHIITPIGMLGYGFDDAEFQAALLALAASGVPTAIILDSGSTDSGPKKLASGDLSCPRSSYLRDLSKLLRAVSMQRFPLLVGSAGGAGINDQVDVLTGVVKEIAQKNTFKLKVLKIYADISQALVTERLKSGAISGCGALVPELTQDAVDECYVVTSQMGPEPYLEAMEQDPDFDVIIGGRSYDPAPYFAFAISCFKGHDVDCERDAVLREKVEGGIMHLSKLMECGALCADPKSAGAIGTIYVDGTFDIVPTDPRAKCTPTSVAAHTLYEKPRPDILYGPGGWLDLTETVYTQRQDGRTVMAKGAIFKRSVEEGLPYQVKLEGARNRGFRSMYMGGIKDPILIREIDTHLNRVKTYVHMQQEGLEDAAWDLDFHVYGRDTKEIFIVGEALAPTQEMAASIASIARIATIHGTYPGQKATSGNMAWGICGSTERDMGECTEFCVYHLMDLKPGEETSLFRIEAVDFDFASNGVSSGTESSNNPAPKIKTKDTSSAVAIPQKGAFSPLPNTNIVNLATASTLGDVAKVVRSKNAGPYEITLDVLFDRREIFDVIKDSNVLSKEKIADLFELQPEQVIWCGFFEQAVAFKATIPRLRNGNSVASGGFMERDVHGAQMYVPLMQLALPLGASDRLRALQ